jgi:DNA-binding GntR family transcriptional regulator
MSRLSTLQARLASQIVQHARQADLAAGHRLTEEGIAALFGVSRSPVRAALRFLRRQGVVRVDDHRGFSLARRASRLKVSIPETDEDALYFRIVNARLAGELPTEVTEAEMMRRFRVGRGLLTRVLRHLAHDGVVKRRRGYGWSFLPMIDSPEAREESYRFRLLIEPAALLEPTFRLDPERAAAIRAGQRRILADRKLTSMEMFELNATFHEALASFSGNRFFFEAVQQQNRLRRLIEFKAFRQRDRITQSCGEHLGILDALEQGEREWAATLMRRHLEVASRLRGAFADLGLT